jgi:transcription antitermination factor NusB
MAELFEDFKNEEKKEVFEKFLTYRRRMARLCAVQAMYLYDVNQKIKVIGDDVNDLFGGDQPLTTEVSNLCYAVLYFYKNIFFIKDEYGSNRKNKKIDEKCLNDIVYYCIKNMRTIDDLISEYLNERWTIDRLDVTIRAILRCAITEILYNIKTDVPILTSEYTNLTSNFFVSKEIGFVNGLIDRIAKDRRRTSSSSATSTQGSF